MAAKEPVPQTASFRPLEPLTPPNPRIWRKLKDYPAKYALGNRAVVEETTGQKQAEHQQWSWRVIKFGAGKPGVASKRDDAMRRAEFLLGVGEMEVEK